MSHKQIMSEYLGDVDARLLLQNLVNINPAFNTIDRFSVEADYEYEWEGDSGTELPRKKRLVQLRLEPVGAPPAESP